MHWYPFFYPNSLHIDLHRRVLHNWAIHCDSLSAQKTNILHRVLGQEGDCRWVKNILQSILFLIHIIFLLVFVAVALFCLLSTLSTAFEHSYARGYRLIDDAYRPCNQTLANVSPQPQPLIPSLHMQAPSPSASTTPLPTVMLPTPVTPHWQDSRDSQDLAGRSTEKPLGGLFLAADVFSGGGSGDGGVPGTLKKTLNNKINLFKYNPKNFITFISF